MTTLMEVQDKDGWWMEGTLLQGKGYRYGRVNLGDMKRGISSLLGGEL